MFGTKGEDDEPQRHDKRLPHMTRRRPTILIVEDDAMLLMGYEVAAEDAGADPVTASTLQEGLDAVTPGIDVAILDIRLGNDRVFDVAYRLAEIGVPFLFCSGTTEDMPSGIFSDAPLMQKPVRSDDVVAKAIGMIANDDETCAAA